MGDIEGPHLIPQSKQVRSAVQGMRWDVSGQKLTGERSTLVAIYWPDRDSWVLYLDTNPKTAILIPRNEIATLGYQLTRKPEQQ